MKLKVVVASLAVAVVAVAAFAFAKPTSPVVYNYKANTANQRLETGHTTELDLRERSVDQTLLKNTSNWTTNPVSFTQSTDMQAYLGSISFNEETTADGGSDGQLTIQEAINALGAQYASSGMQASITVDGSAVITFTPADEAH
jgi:hypothetical protein